MAVPDYQTLMLPILRLLEDGSDWRTAQLRERLAEQFALSEEDITERIPSGGATRFTKNVDWSRHYLKRAGVLEAPSRAVSRLTERGRELLAENPERVDNAVLQQYEEFSDFRPGLRSAPRPVSTDGDDAPTSPVLAELNPDDALRENYRQYRAGVTDELRERVLEQSPEFFESLVIRLMERLGYAGEHGRAIRLGRSGDGGVDGVVSPDRLGLESVYLQAKRWESQTVGRPDVQGFSGSLDAYGATKGVFITTSSFSAEARAYVQSIQKTIVLIDGERLVELMYEVNLGVTTQDTLELKQVDSDFFNIE